MGQHRSGERGQILILGALMMTVMLGFLGLVIDVGNAYAQRRFMQNAADAASVAAARQLAFGMQTGVSDAAVLDTINTYLAANVQAYQNGTGARPSGCSGNGFAGFGNGSPFVYSDYVDTPSDCALGTRDMHFSYSTLNV